MHYTSGSFNWHRAFLYNNFIIACYFGDHSSRTFNILQVGGSAASIAKCLCWRIHRYEYEFGLVDSRVDVVGKEKVFVAARLHHVVQTRLRMRTTKVE